MTDCLMPSVAGSKLGIHNIKFSIDSDGATIGWPQQDSFRKELIREEQYVSFCGSVRHLF